MALIGEIRKRPWILMAILGFALAGFVFMDMFSGPRGFTGGGTDLGEVDGDAIDQRQFEQAYNALYAGSNGDVYQQREQLWNYMVEERAVGQEARAVGLMVTPDEREDLLYGTDLSPIIQTRFRDPQTGQVNREGLNSFRDAERNGIMNDPTQVDPARARFWNYQKGEVEKQRLQDKLATLVAKSMYTPDWMAEELAKGQNTRVDLAYVRVPYDAIPDDAVELTDADYEAYLNEEGARLRRDEPGRALAYAAFDVVATDADSAQLRDDLAEVANSWREAASDTLFVTQQRGEFPSAYLADDQLPEAVRGQEVGAVVGPYLDGSRFTVAKVIDRKAIADSVRSRHILLPASNQEELSRSIALADSLENLIDTDAASFDELARQFSTGPTSTKGGDLGYVAPGAMVGPFNDLIFYSAEEGEVERVLTQFGLHLVEVTGRKFDDEGSLSTRVATISEDIEPSSKTQKDVYSVAAEFAQRHRSVEDFLLAARERDDVTLVEDVVTGPNDYALGDLGSGNAAREVIKWAFKNDEGAVSPNVYAFKAPGKFYDGTYVVAAVAGELLPGIPSGATAYGIVEDAVRRRKKAALVGEVGDIEAVAQRYGVEADTARAVNFNSAFVPGLGSEPAAIAQAFSLPEGQTSEAFAGQTGVFLVRPLVRTEPGDVSANVANVRRGQAGRIQANVRNRFGLALRESAEVEDNRARFY